MNHKKIYTLFFGLFLIINLANSQDNLKTFVAKSGDGIISILRREGLDISTYYQKFIDLNKDQISNGSLLKLGQTYKIPYSDTSFSNMGRKISLSEDNLDSPIFDTSLYPLSKKDTLLKSTVYYLLFDKFNTDDLQLLRATSETRNEIALRIAKELLEQGARVFLFEYDANSVINLGDYVDAINKTYLKYSDEYQRLLVMDVDQGDFSINDKVSISHFEKSKEGEKFAKSIEHIFKKTKVKLDSNPKKDGIFIDKTNLYLANNALPAMTFIKIDGQNKQSNNRAITDSNRSKFVDLITTGIQIDYSNIVLEDQD
tara:strand:- start:4305 stop:5246 length:942 start_codon:yes stop_codon:yes gene_type:complete